MVYQFRINAIKKRFTLVFVVVVVVVVCLFVGSFLRSFFFF